MASKNWIPFREGDYIVHRACLMTPEGSAAALDNAFIRIVEDRGGRRHLSGGGKVNAARIVKLLDRSDDLDMALDLGENFKYILRTPEIKSGKIFSPDVRSTLTFLPRRPWESVTDDDFETLWAGLAFVS
jgi:hypothetical protein